MIKGKAKLTGSKIVCIKLFKSNEQDEIIRKVLDLAPNKQQFIKTAILKYIGGEA